MLCVWCHRWGNSPRELIVSQPLSGEETGNGNGTNGKNYFGESVCISGVHKSHIYLGNGLGCSFRVGFEMWDLRVAILYQEKSDPFPLIPSLLFYWRAAKILTFSCLDPKMTLTPPAAASILVHRQTLRLICPLRDPLGQKLCNSPVHLGVRKLLCHSIYLFFSSWTCFLWANMVAQDPSQKTLGRLWRGPCSPQIPEKQALSVSDVSSKLLSLLSWEDKWILPVRLFRWVTASLLEFKGIYWDHGVNKLVNSVAYIKQMFILDHHKDSY